MNVKSAIVSIVYVIQRAEENINMIRRKIEEIKKTQNELLELKKYIV